VQHYNLALNWSSHRCVPTPDAAAPQQLEAPRGGTRAIAAAQHQLRRSRINSVAAATTVAAGDGSGPTTMSGRGGLFLKWTATQAFNHSFNTILFWKELSVTYPSGFLKI